MKQLMNIRILLAMLAVTLTIAACSSSEEVDQIKGLTVTCNNANEAGAVELGYTEGDFQLTVVSDAAWTATIESADKSDWISIFPASGESGQATVRVRVAANASTEGRSATIRIASKKASRTISVQQSGAPIPETYLLEFTHSGESFTLPTFNGGQQVSGTVDWGDNRTDPLTVKSHSYAADKQEKHVVRIELDENPKSFELKELTGVSVIDLSKF